jgi:hypothetical protein
MFQNNLVPVFENQPCGRPRQKKEKQIDQDCTEYNLLGDGGWNWQNAFEWQQYWVFPTI